MIRLALSHPATATQVVAVARAIRRSLIAHHPDPVPPILHGHRSDGTPLDADHLQVWPTVANNRITHVHLAPDSEAVTLAVVRWMTAGGQLRWRTGKTTITVPTQTEIANATAKDWTSATPVAFDRHPKHVTSDRIWGALEVTLRNAGLGTPTLVETHPPSGWPYFYRSKGTPRSFLAHVRIVLPAPVRGPLLIGAGRYYGLGLLTPTTKNAGGMLRQNDEGRVCRSIPPGRYPHRQ